MHEIIQEIDDKVVIVMHEVETTKNKYRISIQAKEALLNYTEAIPNHLVYLYDYFPNSRSNGKILYSKFYILHNKDMDKIMIVVKDMLVDQKFYSKYQSL